MTRINTLHPSLLLNKQLLDEYRELPRIINKLAKGGSYKNIPVVFTYGVGHESFFGDKAHWLHKRHQAILVELNVRRQTTPERFKGPYIIDTTEAFRKVPLQFANDWHPAKEDHLKCVDRLVERFFGYVNKSYIGHLEINATNIWTHWLIDIANKTKARSEISNILFQHKPTGETL